MKHFADRLSRQWASHSHLWYREQGATTTVFSVLAGIGMLGTALIGVFASPATGIHTAPGIPWTTWHHPFRA